MLSRRSLASRLAIEIGGALGPAWIAERRLARRARSRPLLRAINLHGTPAPHADRLRSHLEWLSRHFTVVDPDRLSVLWGAKASAERPHTLITFDDGLASNFDVAAPILDSLGLRALFFVVPAFADMTGAAARDYFYRQIQPHDHAPERAPEEEWRPMSRDQIRRLAARHAIGNHTRSHLPLATVPAADLASEIAGSRATLEAWTGQPIAAFAWTFAGSSIDQRSPRVQAAVAAADAHQFVFWPCPGTNDTAVDSPARVWRANVEAGWTRAAWRFMLSGLGDPRWRRLRVALQSMTHQR